MSNNTDYKKPYTNVYELLPETLKTETNRAFLENVVNRFLTKSEIKPIHGTVGKKSTRIDLSTRIPEPTVHRQAYQLQPLMYKKIASIDHIMSYYDVLEKAVRLGVNKDDLPSWGNTEQFNFAPPIDFDKLINWDKYYWYDPANSSSTPQYVTIKNMCSVATARVNAKTALHDDLIASGTATPDEIALSSAELSILEVLRDCSCFEGSTGWDKTQWDDNPENWIADPSLFPHTPPGSPILGDMYYDVIDEELKYYNGTTWELFAPSTSSLGIFPWDSIISDACFSQTDEWSKQNKWLHQKDVPNITLAKRAEMPILEYNPFLELNQWSYTKHTWAYRGSDLFDWETVDTEPTLYEMGVKFEVNNFTSFGEIFVDGDHSSALFTGTPIHVEINGSSYEFIVTGTDLITPHETKITVSEVNLGDIASARADWVLSPSGWFTKTLTETSRGDPWQGFFKHWALVETSTPIPVSKQERPATTTQEEFGPIPTPTSLFTLTSGEKFLIGQDTIRVYVDGRRQYGTYQEIAIPLDPDYGNAIEFYDPLPIASVVVIELDPAALSDYYLKEVEVRTSTESDFNFAGYDHPVLSLVKYKLVEQVKTQTTQYPLFDIFNVDGTTTNKANSIFMFEESSSYSVDPRIGRRIKITSSGKEFHFVQLLSEEDDGELFCYKDRWSIDTSNPEGLQTIWRTGTPATVYVPRYVNEYQLADGDSYVDPDGNTQTASVPYGSGDWELAAQLFYNVHHENRVKIKFSELVTHCKTIVEAQQPPTGFSDVKSDFYRLLDKPNYGVGGTIKEFNDSYDTFLSAMFQTTGTPRSIIDFAQRQYEYNLTLLKEMCIRYAVSLLTKTDDETIWDAYGAVADYVITQFEQNDALDFAFGDSTAYNQTTGKGIKNWITTLPFLRLAFPVEPMILEDDTLGIKQILHHDGHISDVEVPKSMMDAIYLQLLNQTGGVESNTKPAWDVSVKGQYWKDATTGVLYRFTVVSTGATTPSPSNPVGSFWLNGASGQLYVRTTTGWEKAKDEFGVDLLPGVTDPAWLEVNIEDLVTRVVYEAEHRLFEAVPEFSEPIFDFGSLLSDAETFVQYLKEQFYDYVQQTSANPFESSYVQTDPFTWNYSEVTGYADPIVGGTDPGSRWGGSWETIYQNNFGTQYPHLMPWRLQGYIDKPQWWDAEYNTESDRRWNNTMWQNIKDGIVPIGLTLPSGSTSTGAGGEVTSYWFVCVNTTTDQLLPPYVNGSTETFLSAYPSTPTLDDIFAFGEGGNAEHDWKNSTYFLYGLLHVAFRMQPVRFLHYTFGPEFVEVAGLQINKETHKVFSHRDTAFHGDLDQDNDLVVQNGLNQWYVNFIRYNNFDVNTSDFVEKWINWDGMLSYQTGSFINTKSMDVSTKYFQLIERDYQVLVKKTPDMEDFWVDALLITTQAVGTDWTVSNNSKIPRYNGGDWVFRIDTPAPIERGLTYYGVKKYACLFDPATDVGTTSVVLPWALVQGNPIPGEDILYVPDDTLTWFTGSPVQISSDGGFPAPLKPNTTYYIIKIENNKFKLANSYNEAVAGIAVDITTVPTSTLFVEEVKGTFISTNGSVTLTTWKHLGIDKRTVHNDLMPSTYQGVETLINIVDGYAAYLEDQGWSFNDTEAVEIDVSTGQILNWQTEIERLINRIYSGLGRVTTMIDDPLQPPSPALYHEVNPFRNNIWFNTERGIITNIYTGPYSDIRVDTTLYDQVGKPLPNDSLFIFRSDKKSRIRGCSLSGSVYAHSGNVSSEEDAVSRPYSDTHLAGAHIFLDGYEHIILFNKYTTENYLVYDPFLGLSSNKFTLVFEKGTDYTFRPNIGGYYLNDKNTVQNIEHSVENMQYFYDTYQVNETADYLDYARSLLGYESPDYLDHIDVGPKSKFVFWKGMVQNKGAVSSIKAFINARLFVDAKVDEFWAYKVAEYGNVNKKRFNDVVIQPEDVRKNELRLHFTNEYDPIENTFREVAIGDESRWIYLPDQRPTIDPELNMYFEAEVSSVARFPLPYIGSLPSEELYDGFVDITVAAENTITDALMIIAQDDVTFTRHVLSEGIDYSRVNDNLLDVHIGFEGPYYDLGDAGYAGHDGSTALYVYNMNASREKHNPAKLIDMKTMNVVSTIFIWHPATGFHYHVPMKEIDTTAAHDPAKYNNVIDTTSPIVYPNDVYNPHQLWNMMEVGKIWLRPSSFGYVPYYNPSIFPNVSDRIYHWGRAADWSTFDVLQWTESPVPPTEWEIYVEEQAENTEIDQYSKPSGTPMKVIYRRVNISTVDDDVEYSAYQRVDVNPRDSKSCSVLPLYSFDPSNSTRRKIPLKLFDSLSGRQDHVITNGQTLKVYVNGFYKGDVQARSVISTILVEPPEESQEGDLFYLTAPGAGDWSSFGVGEYVEWDGTAWNAVTDVDTLFALSVPSTWTTVTEKTYIAPTVSGQEIYRWVGKLEVLTEPPVDFEVNDSYKVGSLATGDWTGHDGEIATWNGSAWVFIVDVWDVFSEGDYVMWNGSSWEEVTDANALSALTVSCFEHYTGGAYVDLAPLGLDLGSHDVITIEYPIFDNDVETISTENIEYSEFTPYSRVDTLGVAGDIESSKYYFWVTNKNVKPKATGLSLIEIGALLKDPSVPYMFMQGFRPAGLPAGAPARFSQVIIRGISRFITEADRFKIRFLFDNSLRDSLNIKDGLTSKNVHTEWEIFRKDQPFVISKVLWDKLTESVIGHKLNDSTIPVPSLERVLYDQVHETATRIGFGEGQTFVDKELALNTIIAEIENPEYDLYPIDKSFFLDTYSFDTPEHIKESMEYIYNTFPHLDTNRIFFSCLHDALSLKKEYDGVFKTSAIALHGIRILETVDRAIDD